MPPIPKWVTYIIAAGLTVGALKMPYGYYTILRLASFCYFTLAAVYFAKTTKSQMAWLFGLLALLFNPFIKVHLEKSVWAVIDIVSAGCVLLATSKLAPQKKP